ncbi:hypothetical protein QSJ18_03025 [Gordonia sp. ABSL1-1]|uniref:hypothetical protein n=1 Tax=Gordonia sp. ABSL1-1 TaxID=3053923 RepID=UPI002573473D|nr:hypothetical protein [Gordonia sp. ABSL1-1]MDL9935709.1 hypothetical protein [Gordonia sp. ABSL1-1]
MNPLAPERLTPDDDLFVRMEHALGLPVTNQCVWQIPGDTPEHVITDLADRLRRGRLSRLVRRRRVPGRDRWIHTPGAGRFRMSRQPIPAGAEAAWARDRVDEPLDTRHGPSWRLTTAPSSDGESIFVSLIVSHVVADGGAIMAAVSEAVAGIDYDATDAAGGVIDSLRDSATLIATAGRMAFAMAADRSSSTSPTARAVPPLLTTPSPTMPGGDAAYAPTTIRTIDAADFRRAAQDAGGTANTLFVAIMVGVLEDSGRVARGTTIGVSLPMSARTDGDRRANATTGVTASVEVSADRYRDLGPLRTACKEAYRSAAAGPGPTARLGIVAQALGDRMVARLAAGLGAPLCLASNLGDLDDDFASLGSALPGPVAMRSVAAVGDGDRLRRMAGGVSGWVSQSAGTITLCATSLDPDRITDDAALTAALDVELARWGLTAAGWGGRRPAAEEALCE